MCLFKGLNRVGSYMLAIVFIKMPTAGFPLSQRQPSECHLCLTLPSVWVMCYLMREGTEYKIRNGP